MKEYTKSFDKMIDNMIMKAIVSKVIGDKIEELMNTLQARIDSRTVKEKQALDKTTANASLTEADIDTKLIMSGVFNKENLIK